MRREVQEIDKLLLSLLLAVGLYLEVRLALLEVLVLPGLRVYQLHWEVVILILAPPVL